ALKAAITTTPIVFTTSTDPVQIGLVASISRPGGNITGATTLAVELAPKRLELAHELVPTASVIAALINPTNRGTAEPQLRGLQAAAHTFGLQLHIVHASIERDFDTGFANLAQSWRTAGSTVHEDPHVAQPQDRQDARPCNTADAARARRRGD